MTNGGSDQQRNKINRFGLNDLFDAILIEGEMGFGKPDREVYTTALDSLNIEPDAAWSIGDNLEWDVWGPQQLGIFGIWNMLIKRGFQNHPGLFLIASFILLLNWSKLCLDHCCYRHRWGNIIRIYINLDPIMASSYHFRLFSICWSRPNIT